MNRVVSTQSLSGAWTIKVQQLRAMIESAKLNGLTPLDTLRAFKGECSARIKDLRKDVAGLRTKSDPEDASAAVNTDLVELEYLKALSRAVPERDTYAPRIADLCSSLLDAFVEMPEDIRAELVTSGLGASIDAPAKRKDWIARAQKVVAPLVAPVRAHDGLVYNLVMALAVDAQLDSAVSTARLLTQADPMARLLLASLLAGEKNRSPCVYFLHAYFGELLNDAAAQAKRFEDIKTLYSDEKRALVLLAWGYQGIYALMWSAAQADLPAYVNLLTWSDAESLRLECGRLPWGRFLNRRTMKDAQRVVFNDKDYQLLKRIWSTILDPLFTASGPKIEGIDIIPVGWLGLIPWIACGKEPASGDYIGQTCSLALVPQFSFLRSSRVVARSEGCGLFFVRGSYAGDIEAACLAEERAFKNMGFEMIEARAEIMHALENGLVVHFSGHGKNPPPESGWPYFDLRDGSQLTTSDLLAAGMNKAAPFVSFSACELGFCYFGNGETAGLPTCVLSKGTIACVGCQGEIKAKVAADFFPAFYKELLAGKRVGEAAKVGLRRRGAGDPGSRNLGLWAPFVVYGDQWASIEPPREGCGHV